MTNFVPDLPKESRSVPYFEDVTSEEGWQGFSTTKSIRALQSEITQSMARLGAMVTGFQKGIFNTESRMRSGFRIHYILETPDGQGAVGRLDIAALPNKNIYSGHSSSLEVRQDKSLRMALYMIRMFLDGTWFAQQLSPGYSALMPFMIGPGDKTISELWAESSVMKNILPPGNSEFVDGEYKTNG